MHTYTLSDLQQHIRRVLALNYPEPLWITAEIAQANRSRGHLYLDLVQKGAGVEADVVAQAQAVLWQREYQRLKLHLGLTLDEVLQAGREVRMQVRVDYHERYGLKLALSDLDPAYTFGQLELQRRQTIQTLRQLGLLDRNKSLLLPPVLQRIAVISSEGAAGFQDFREHLAANNFGYQFDCQLFVAAVQGKNVEAEVAAALEQIASRRAHFDAVLVLRGGGARLDLAAFDRLELCKAAAALPLPLFTGIGHDIDETVLDLVAHTALKTPTAVADFLIQHNLFFENTVLQLAGRIREQTDYHLKIRTVELTHQESALRWGAQQSLQSATRNIQQMTLALPVLARQPLRRADSLLEQAGALCAALHPDAVLRRGFSLTFKAGKVLTTADAVASGDVLETRLREGKIASTVVKGTSSG